MTVILTPYITLDGRVKEAIQFYEQAIGAVTYGEMPDMPNTFTDDLRSLVAHAKLKVGVTELMFSDAPGGTSVENGKRETGNHLHYNE